jgi:RNA polymerase sigma factor (sigma-70 family)
MKKSKSSRSPIDIEKEVKEARTIKGRKDLRKEIDLDVSERDVEEWTDKVSISPYWDQAQLNKYNEETEILEDARANPDYVDTSKSHEVFPKPFKSEKVDRLYKKLGIEEKLKRLTVKEREVLGMICNRYSQKETAEMLNISDGSVYNTLNKAKNKLKN